MLETVTIPSRRHGARTFHRIGSMPYVRKDGSETSLAVWRGTCVVCGEPFEVTTPTGIERAEQSRSFTVVTCPAHRKTV